MRPVTDALRGPLGVTLVITVVLVVWTRCTPQEEAAVMPPPLWEYPRESEPQVSSTAIIASGPLDGPKTSAAPFFQDLSVTFPLRKDETFVMRLRPNLSYVVKVDDWRRASNSVPIVVFDFQAEKYARGIFAVSDRGLSGTVSVDGLVFLVTPIGNKRHRIDEVKVLTLPKEEEPVTDADGLTLLPPPADTDQNFRVLLVFSSELTGFCQTPEHVSLYEAKLVEALGSVGITTPISVVPFCSEIDSDGGDFLTQLRSLATSSDIAARRDAVDADLVSLVVARGTTCGRAYYTRPTIADSRHRGFSVVRFDCALTNESFVHEIGHNLGLLHDRASTATTSTDCNYDYFVSNPQGTQFTDRTIMSLKSSVCPNCTRVLTFSDFAKGHGVPCTNPVNGTQGPADNAVEIQLPFEVTRRFY